MEDSKKILIDFFIRYGFQIIGAAIILGAGLVMARWVGRIIDRLLGRRDMEPPMRILIVRTISFVVIVFTLVLALDKLGVQVAPLVAGIGVAGVGVGLAMQGVLGNVVAGLTIIFTKPFRVGEYVDLAGVQGQVTSVELFSTVLLHADNSRVVVPNRKIVGEILHNYGAVRQLDLSVGVSYAANVDEVLAAVREIVSGHPRVLKEPAPVVGITSLGDSAITIAIKPWVSVSDYVAAQGELYQAIVKRFRAGGIEIPFPQREVRLLGKAPGESA